MEFPGIEQAQLLSDVLSKALEQFAPGSVAILGCAGGNGFERIPSGVSRVVGIDLNPQFVAATEARFGGRFQNLELIAGDIQDHAVSFAPVDLIFAGLFLEYVDVEIVIARTSSLLTAAGHLVTVLQVPDVNHRQVSTSPFSSLQAVGEVMQLVPPFRLQSAAEAQGYIQLDSHRIASAGGKQFQAQIFGKTPTLQSAGPARKAAQAGDF